MLVELLSGAGLATLYWWEVSRHGLLPPNLPAVDVAKLGVSLHVQFAVHASMIWLMLVGSLIDVDEKTIPDAITVPGTWLGLSIAAAYPWSLLPAPHQLPGGRWEVYAFLTLSSPRDWPLWLNALGSLAIGLACWGAWCFAVMRRTWYVRHGWCRAMSLSGARLRREALGWRGMMAVIGCTGIAGVWCWGGNQHWIGLLSALVGMAASGGLIWLVRIIGGMVLGREAMGFGDVTLMAMLGALLGWQPCLMIFFLAPLAGMVLALLTLFLRKEREIPYGPFLCLAALAVVVGWSATWNGMTPLWSGIAPVLGLLGPWIIPLMAVGLAMLAVLLAIVHAVKRLLGFES